MVKGRDKKKKAGARKIAFDALWRVEAKGHHADAALDLLFSERRVEERERSFASELAYGTLRWRGLLDFHIGQALDRPLSRLERNALIALRLGAYQILLLDRVPPSAAVNESVSLAPPGARGLVNAVLRKLASGEDLADPGAISDPAERLSVVHSHPAWMVEYFFKYIGAEETEKFLSANNVRPVLSLRANSGRTSREALARLLQKEGVNCSAGRLSPLAVTLERTRKVADLPGFSEGLFAVQDEASQLAALVLAPCPGETVLDACAAPGVKSLQIMQLMKGNGRVAAVDKDADRLESMSAEAVRMGVKNVTRIVGDWSEEISWPGRFRNVLFDRVLVDAPCTGLGTIRRRPEIKWNRRPGDPSERSGLQRGILDEAIRLVRPGGYVVYSTCTLTAEENDGVLRPYLEDGRLALEDPAGGHPHLSPLVKDGAIRTWPHLTGTDGFTIYKLRKPG